MTDANAILNDEKLELETQLNDIEYEKAQMSTRLKDLDDQEERIKKRMSKINTALGIINHEVDQWSVVKQKSLLGKFRKNRS